MEGPKTWHDLFDIIGAIATAAAVVIALAGIWVERSRASAAEARADAAEDERRSASETAAAAARRAQAELVVGYPVWVVDLRAHGGVAVRGHWEYAIDNYSNSPVFDVNVVATVNGAEDSIGEGLLLRPGASERQSTTATAETDAVVVTTRFRDLAGVHWKRYQNGVLFETDEYGQPI